MAKSTARSAKSEKKTGASRASKPTAVEVVEEGGGDGVETAIAVVTALVLIVAIVLVDHELGAMGSGLFFKG
jgi:nucleoside permease NupC